MSKINPLITVIICTYDTKDLTVKCLQRLISSSRQLGQSIEIIVVDNGRDSTGAVIKNQFPQIILITPGKNLGYAKGNNLGLKKMHPESRYILLLNSDALINNDTLIRSLDFFSRHPECDVLGCQLLFTDGRMQPSAGFLPTPVNTCLWMLGFDKLIEMFPVHPHKPSFFASDRQVGWIMGAFLMMKRQVYESTSGFDESFFMYMEEVEWCRRITEAGYRIWYTPSFKITHLDKASSQGNLKAPLTKEMQGLVYYLRKFYPQSLWWTKSVILLGIIGRYLFFTIKGDKLLSGIYREMIGLL